MTTPAAKPFGKKQIHTVLGQSMACIDEGQGDAIVFLHGNPTSSYLWRNIMPHCQGMGRLVAPDLIGMGDSAKLADSSTDSYTFAGHAAFLDALLDQLDLGNRITLVVHDWGSALGFNWARRHPERIAGLVYMEAIVRPVTWDEWPENAVKVFQGFRSDAGEAMVLEKNIFVERVFPGSVIREMDEAAMTEYRRPFLEAGEARRPTLTWPRQIPIEGSPGDVTKIVNDYAGWLAETDTPKLFVNADPGSILVGAQREFCRSWPSQQEITVSGTHFIQEDSPEQIGAAVRDFVSGNDNAR